MMLCCIFALTWAQETHERHQDQLRLGGGIPGKGDGPEFQAFVFPPSRYFDLPGFDSVSWYLRIRGRQTFPGFCHGEY